MWTSKSLQDTENTLVRALYVKVPVKKVQGTYSTLYFITTDGEVVTSSGEYFPKSKFNGAEVTMLGCTSNGATFVTNKGVFCTGNSYYGDLGVSPGDVKAIV